MALLAFPATSQGRHRGVGLLDGWNSGSIEHSVQPSPAVGRLSRNASNGGDNNARDRTPPRSSCRQRRRASCAPIMVDIDQMKIITTLGARCKANGRRLTTVHHTVPPTRARPSTERARREFTTVPQEHDGAELYAPMSAAVAHRRRSMRNNLTERTGLSVLRHPAIRVHPLP